MGWRSLCLVGRDCSCGRGFGCADSLVISLFWAGGFLCVKDYFGGARVGCRVGEG